MATQTALNITDEDRWKYQEDGFFILESAIPEEDLQMLRDLCDQLVAEQEEEMDRLGTDQIKLSKRGKRYFVFLAYRDHPELGDFIFSDTMAEVCKATIGENAMLFWEQFVVKGTSGSEESAFSWHQDSGYCAREPKPYVNAWVPLDDVHEKNGTIYLLPYAIAGTRDRVEHTIDERTGDKVGYFGDHPGIPVVAPAGSIVVFSSTCFHRSGPNKTTQMRRAYATQFSPEPVLEPDDTLKGLAEPLLVEGGRVR